MSTFLYKKLVEVRFLNDFYLAAFDESSFFDLSETDRLVRLGNLLGRTKYDIRKDIRVVPTASTIKFMDNHRMRFIQTSVGFFLAAEVIPVVVGGVDRYKMVIPPDGNPDFEFSLQVINPQFGNITNLIQVPGIKSSYFLTNNNPDSNKVYPSLSLPVLPFSMGDTYEMGALAYIGGTLRQAQKKTSSAASGWVQLANDHHWLNLSDRHLLPTRFRYGISNPGVTSASFALLDAGSANITTVNSSDAGISKITDDDNNLVELIIDFTTYVNGTGDEITLPKGSYTLEVSENGSLVKTLRVHFYNDIAMGFAGILLNPKITDPDFMFLEDIGSEKALLVRRPDGTHPLFEVRLKNRSTYWRYHSVTSHELEAKNKAGLFLDAPAAGGFLITKDPKSLQQEPVYFVDGADKVFLPNPINSHIKPETDGKLYSDIFLSEIKGLIENKI